MVKFFLAAVKVSTDSMGQADSESRRLLKISALLNSLVAGLLIAAAATLIAWIFQLAPRYIVQTLIIFTVLLIALTPFLSQHLPLTRFGPANQVTLIRAGIAALMAGLAGTPPPNSAHTCTFASRTPLPLSTYKCPAC